MDFRTRGCLVDFPLFYVRRRATSPSWSLRSGTDMTADFGPPTPPHVLPVLGLWDARHFLAYFGVFYGVFQGLWVWQ